MLTYGSFNLLPLYGGEIVVSVYSAPPSASVDGNSLAWQSRCQRIGEGAHRVIILAKDDAPVIQPRFPLTEMGGEKVRYRCGLRITGLRAGQLVYNCVQVSNFFWRKLFQDPFYLTERFLVVQRFASRHFLSCGAPGGETRTNTLQKQSLHETCGFRALTQGIRKRFSRPIGQVEGMAGDKPQPLQPQVAIGPGWSV